MDDPARRLEAVMFISPHPVAREALASACDLDERELEIALDGLHDEYVPGRHGLCLAEVAGGFTFAVAHDCEPSVERFAGARPPDALSPALLETLAVVAYLQPTTRAEVAQVRGVSSEWALTGLVERGLVEEEGRAETPGSPILYATTRRFLQLFGLRALGDLTDLSSFALGAADAEELRARLLANAERRTP